MAAGKRRPPEENRGSKNSPDGLPPLERLDRIESRITAFEAQPKDIEALRLRMNEYRQRIDHDVAVIQKGLADIAKSIPALLESIVAPRVEEKVSARIAALEKVVLDQSVLVNALSHRAIVSDMNRERLIAAAGRLCDRTNESPDYPPTIRLDYLPIGRLFETIEPDPIFDYFRLR